MPTTCLARLLSTTLEMIPNTREANDNPVRLRTRPAADGKAGQLEIALAGRYAYIIHTKPLRSLQGPPRTVYIPTESARIFAETALAGTTIKDGQTTVTHESLRAEPLRTAVGGGAAPVAVAWVAAPHADERYPKLDQLRNANNRSSAVTVHMRTHETARLLELVCRTLETREERGAGIRPSQNQFVVWNFQMGEVQALDGRLRMPLARLCTPDNKAEYRAAPPLELHAPRLRRIIEYWTRRHSHTGDRLDRMPVEYLTAGYRIRVATQRLRDRMTETVLQCAK